MEQACRFLLSGAGYALHALGRLKDAVEPRCSAMSRAIKGEDWREAAIAAANLSLLLLTLGELDAAVDYGRRSRGILLL